jgi:hypothetical protein
MVKDQAYYAKLKAEIMALRPEDVPDAPSKAEIARRRHAEAERLARAANCSVLEIVPGKGGRVGKKWRMYVDKATSYREVDRSVVDEMWELTQRVGEAARRARMLSDPLGLYGGEESIDDVVKRQDETR